MFCQQTKEYLSQKNVTFVERNILEDPAALDELRRLGFMTTPVVTVGDTVIVGFDQVKLDTALGS